MGLDGTLHARIHAGKVRLFRQHRDALQHCTGGRPDTRARPRSKPSTR